MLFQETTTSPSQWDSLGQMNLLQQRLNRLFSSIPETRQADFPPVNVWASEDKALVVAEVPGIDPDNIDVQVVNQTLTLKTKRHPEQLAEGQAWHRRERGYGEFSRSLELPFTIEPEKVKASFSQGMLRVELPRAAADLPKKITVQAS
ncbi:MAG TPA: Hsp20/alpha crystallin family protein [Oculatellaceae cyanobacterium]